MKSRLMLTAIIVLSLAASTPSSARADRKNPPAESRHRTISFAITLPPSLLGRGASQVWSDLLKFSKTVRAKTGVNIRLIKTKSQEETIALLEKGEAQFAWVEPYNYAKEKSKRRPGFSPLVIYTSGKSATSRSCIYRIPGKGERKKTGGLASMRGKRNAISLTDEADWTLLNMIFRAERYTFEPHFFFSGFSVSNSESAALSLLFDSSNSVVMNELSMKYMVEMDRRLKAATTVACAPPLPNTMIAASNSLSEGDRKALQKIFVNMRGDKDFAYLEPYFKTTDGSWGPANVATFEPWEKLYKETLEAGWDNTFETLSR